MPISMLILQQRCRHGRTVWTLFFAAADLENISLYKGKINIGSAASPASLGNGGMPCRC